MSEDDTELLMLTGTALSKGGGQAESGIGLHLISEQDIDRLKRAAERMHGRDPENLPQDSRDLLEAVDALLLKGGWAEGPEMSAEILPAQPPAADLPAGEIVEGRQLPRSGAMKGVARGRGGKAGAEDKEPEKEPEKDWSGDSIVFPIELMGVLHDSILELSRDGAEEGPAREALIDLIDQMEGILDGIADSEQLARLASLKKL